MELILVILTLLCLYHIYKTKKILEAQHDYNQDLYNGIYRKLESGELPDVAKDDKLDISEVPKKRKKIIVQ